MVMRWKGNNNIVCHNDTGHPDVGTAYIDASTVARDSQYKRQYPIGAVYVDLRTYMSTDLKM